jgi:hypothetical protein
MFYVLARLHLDSQISLRFCFTDLDGTGLLEEIPPIAKDIPPQKYDPSVSLGINIYVVIHFAVLIAVNSVLLDHKPDDLDFSTVLTVSAYIFYTLTAFGWIFDGRKYAIEGEFLRSLFVCGAIEVAKQKDLLPEKAIVFQAFQLLSGLWLISSQGAGLKRKEIKTE